MVNEQLRKRLEKFTPKIEPEEFPGTTLGGKIGNTLIRFFAKIINATTDWFEERLINFAVGTLITFEKEYSKIAVKLATKMLDIEEIPEELKPFLEEIKEPKSPAGAAIATAFGSAALGGIVGTALTNPLRFLSYALNKLTPNLLVSPEEAILAFRRGKVSPGVLNTILKSYGYSEERQEIKKHALKAVLGMAEVRDLSLRGEIRNKKL
ncbi:unnamed protein product [marine sediment metagenome]|uniref:Uncharacterized protein n=1 Tax=marine sediment metagenome TaxID=412755 RepID=X1IX09_9ZZZZ